MLTEQSIKGLGTTIQEVKNVLLSRTLFKNQVGTFQIVWDYSSHLLNFLDPEYKEYLENSRKFIRMLPSSSEKEAK